MPRAITTARRMQYLPGGSGNILTASSDQRPACARTIEDSRIKYVPILAARFRRHAISFLRCYAWSLRS
jgi:hypothetical protein